MNIETFQKELTVLGGLNLRGEPNLRVVRGDQEMKFACGQMIPKYFILGGATVTIEKFFRKRHIFASTQVQPCTREEAKDIWMRSRKFDLTNHWMPETYDKITVTPTARNGYFIEQYYPPDKIKDTPERWEQNRYRMFSPHPAIPEKMTDMIGAFPSHGVYENFMEGDELSEQLLASVRGAWARRDRWKQVKSNDLMIKDVFMAAQQRDDANEARVKEMLDAQIVPHAFQGVYLNTPSKFIHKGETDFHVDQLN